MDSSTGNWTSCVASDGAFDETNETFTCTQATPLSLGNHTIYLRAIDSLSNTTSSSAYSFDIFTIVTSSTQATAQSPVPQIPQSSGGNGGGVFKPTGDSNTGNQLVTVIIEPKTFNFDAFLSSVALEVTTLKSFDQSTKPSQRPKSNAVLAGGKVLGIKTSSGTNWQVGNLEQVWYKAYAPGYSTNNAAKIIPELQNKPSIIALTYVDQDLVPMGKPKSKFNANKLKLAHSLDGIIWKILPTSVVDPKNHTVAALHNIGGYYMVVGR